MTPIWKLVRYLTVFVLVLTALGAAVEFVIAAAIASDPYWDPAIDLDLYMLGTGGGFVAICVAIFGLIRRMPVAALAGATGMAAADALLLGVLEASDPPGDEIAFYRTLFAIVLLLAVSVAVLARRLRPTTPPAARAG